jgi:predicted aspartyl protease
MGLLSILVLPGSAAQVATTGSDPIADLLAQDNVQKAESLLQTAPHTAKNVAYQGEVEFRKGHFAKAQSLYQSALQMDDKTARAHFGLGKLTLAKLKMKDALREFKRAIELDPKEPLYPFYASEAADLDKDPGEMRKYLEQYIHLNPADPDRLKEAKAGLETLAAFKDQKIGVLEAPEQPKPIPFRKLLNLIFTDVTINGQGPFNMAIDTGASQMVVSERVAQKIGLKPIATTVMLGAGGEGKVESPVYKLDTIQMGDVKIKNSPAGSFNDPLLSQVTDGIIGASLLADFVVTVNYPDGRIELSHKNTNTGDPIPAWCFANLLLISVDANGQQGNFVVDTGAVSTVLSHGMANALGVNENTPGAKVDTGIGGVGGLAGVVLMTPRVTIKTSGHAEAFDRVMAIDLKPISKMLQTEVAGLVGFDFLQKYKLTLDYYKAEVRLSK